MPESLLSRRLKLGTFLGIPLFVHWSFSLAIVYVALSTWKTGPTGIAFSIAQLFGVFFCVTLHEYGHAMAARWFGIPTADITLLPIGGVARLSKMPRIPWQELVVAVAGPAVNVAIVTVIVAVLSVTIDPAIFSAIVTYANALLLQGPITDETVNMMIDLLTEPSLLGYSLLMLMVNVMLVVFNLIPAFPMDGGRVFRSVMAMGMDYRRATSIASKVGLFCAAAMAFVALTSDPPLLMPLFIAAFIAYAGMAEARQVSLTEAVRGLCVGEVMVHGTPTLPMDLPITEVLHRWQSIPHASVPVVSPMGGFVGMLSLREVLSKATDEQSLYLAAGQLVDHRLGFAAVEAGDRLEDAITKGSKHQRQLPVLDAEGKVIGVLDLETLLTRVKIPTKLASLEAARSVSPDSPNDHASPQPYSPPMHLDVRS